jgi:uncharacterized delta-60 repeat protein
MCRHIFFSVLLLAAAPLWAQPGTLDASFATQGVSIINTTTNDLPSVGFLRSGDGALVYGVRTMGGAQQVFVAKYTAQGVLDAAFGSNGVFTHNFWPGEPQKVDAALVQPDGKVVLVVSAFTPGAFLVRLTEAGAFDATFDADGIRPLGTVLSSVFDIQMQPDNKMLLFGLNSSLEHRMVRFNANGSPDASLGGANGVLINLFAMASFGSAAGFRYLPSGDWLIFGNASVSPDGHDPFWFGKINNTGGLVTGFGTGGTVLVDPTPGAFSTDELLSVELGPGGSIYFNGYGGLQPFETTYIGKLSANGALDPAFAADGIAEQLPSVTGFVGFGALFVQPDGKLLVGGTYVNGLEAEYSVARFNVSGAFDQTWNTTGISRFDITPGLDYGFFTFAQADGKVVLLGATSSVGLPTALTAARFGTNGIADFSFGSNGFVSTVFGNAGIRNSGARSVKQAAGGNVFVGSVYESFTSSAILFSGYTAAGQPLAGFGANGLATLSLQLEDEVADIELLPDGKILALVLSYSLLGTVELCVVRFGANGTIDNSFGVRGKARLQIPDAAFERALDLVAQPDGKLAVVAQGSLAGSTESQSASWVLRLDASGNLDPTFFSTGYRELDFFGERLFCQPDNKLVVAGNFEQEGESNLAIRRFLATSGNDATFNGGEKTVLNTGGGVYEVKMLQPKASSGLVVAFSKQFDPVGNFSVATYTATGQLDVGAAPGGYFNADLPFDPTSCVLGPNEQVVAGGFGDDGAGYVQARFQRFGLDGTVDLGFGTAGLAGVDIAALQSDYLTNMTLQADGKILATGYTEVDQGFNFFDGFVARLNNGSAASTVYVFNASGLWSNPANWQGGAVPPNPLPSGAEVIINPAGANQECILNVAISVANGAFIRVRPGKKLTVNSQLTVPAFIQQ